MHRLCATLIIGTLAVVAPGCGGESQPNAPAKPTEVGSSDFTKNTTDMMNKANTGMDPKAQKTGTPAPAPAPKK